MHIIFWNNVCLHRWLFIKLWNHLRDNYKSHSHTHFGFVKKEGVPYQWYHTSGNFHNDHDVKLKKTWLFNHQQSSLRPVAVPAFCHEKWSEFSNGTNILAFQQLSWTLTQCNLCFTIVSLWNRLQVELCEISSPLQNRSLHEHAWGLCGLWSKYTWHLPFAQNESIPRETNMNMNFKLDDSRCAPCIVYDIPILPECNFDESIFPFLFHLFIASTCLIHVWLLFLPCPCVMKAKLLVKIILFFIGLVPWLGWICSLMPCHWGSKGDIRAREADMLFFGTGWVGFFFLLLCLGFVMFGL